MLRGARGAITVEENTADCILSNAKIIVKEVIEINNIEILDVASIFFTCTKDLTTAFPAKAVREMGIVDVPLMCFSEMDVEGSLPMCLRILVNFNTEKSNSKIKHVYKKGAKVLRPDLTQ